MHRDASGAAISVSWAGFQPVEQAQRVLDGHSTHDYGGVPGHELVVGFVLFPARVIFDTKVEVAASYGCVEEEGSVYTVLHTKHSTWHIEIRNKHIIYQRELGRIYPSNIGTYQHTSSPRWLA